MSVVFLEIVMSAQEAFVSGIESRDELEDPLEAALSASGFGEVTGGGSGGGVYILDLEVSEQQFDAALGIVRQVLQALKVPISTKIKRRGPKSADLSAYVLPTL